MAYIEDLQERREQKALHWRGFEQDHMFLIGDNIELVTIVEAWPQNNQVEYIRECDGKRYDDVPDNFYIFRNDLFEAMYAVGQHKAGIINEAKDIVVQSENDGFFSRLGKSLSGETDWAEEYSTFDYFHSRISDTNDCDLIIFQAAYDYYNEDTGYSYWKEHGAGFLGGEDRDIPVNETATSKLTTIEDVDEMANWICDYYTDCLE